MRIHEYQAKEILSKFGIKIPMGGNAENPEVAFDLATELGGRCVVKAQVYSGGRGKAGGVKLVEKAEESKVEAARLIGSRLYTEQSGPNGLLVSSVLVEEPINISGEIYVSILANPETETHIAMLSKFGGVDIEELAEKAPEKIKRCEIDPVYGLLDYQARDLIYEAEIDLDKRKSVFQILTRMYQIYSKYYCSLIEINPLAITENGDLIAADAKILFDDDALYKNKELFQLRDIAQEDPLESIAHEYNISYVKLDGDVGCLVNGAGLAMATMDVTTSSGAGPANFLDVGGGASPDKVCEAMKIILSDNDVEKILVNIFGGILRCDLVATGIIKAFQSVENKNIPLIVRMAGTNADQGISILKRSELKVIFVENLDDASIAIREN